MLLRLRDFEDDVHAGIKIFRAVPEKIAAGVECHLIHAGRGLEIRREQIHDAAVVVRLSERKLVPFAVCVAQLQFHRNAVCGFALRRI